jgi:hypothetical protein
VTMISMDKDSERIDSAAQDSLSQFAKLLKEFATKVEVREDTASYGNSSSCRARRRLFLSCRESPTPSRLIGQQSARISCDFVGQMLGTGIGNFAIGFIFTRHDRPTVLFDVTPAVPRILSLHFFESLDLRRVSV